MGHGRVRTCPRAYGDLLREKGEAHEEAFLAGLRAQGREVRDGRAADEWDFDAGARVTAEAMRAGVDVIYQATFVVGNWRGRADFLERIDRPSDLGGFSYEPIDAKLARLEKPTYLLQLCFYADGIAAVQGVTPARMHVLLGIGERRTFRYDDFAAYYRRVRQSFEAATRRTDPTEPYPVDHCALCVFREVCAARWEAEDHLTLVAGVRRAQVERLRAAGITTLAALAESRADVVVADIPAHTLAALQDQARLQLLKRTTGRLDWHALPDEPERGFALLPARSPGDLVFDIEGDPFWEPARGLHFLFGVRGADGYRAFWGHDRAGERAAFEAVVDLFHEHLARYPDMHVYHYGAYEPTALKQLMGVYASREDAVDDLLRREVFVDLYSVVRQGLRAGVPSYSLKDVEALAGYGRAAEVRSGTLAVLAYERWMDDGDAGRLRDIEAYNAEDCEATLALRDWLVAHRPEGVGAAVAPEPPDDERTAVVLQREALRQALVDGAAEGSLPWLAGELLEYHRREVKPAWWWFFTRCGQMSLDDLVDDAESIGRLEPVGAAQRAGQSFEQRMRFPAQQYKLAPGDAPVDPATKKAAGTIVALDEAAGTLVLRRSASQAATPLPWPSSRPGPFGRASSARPWRASRHPCWRTMAATRRCATSSRALGRASLRVRSSRDPDVRHRRAARARRVARRRRALRPGPAGDRQDVDGRAPHRRADAARAACRRRGHEPQGHPQSSRRGGARGAGRRLCVSRSQEGE